MTDAQIIMFLMTSLLIILAPGQDFVLVMSRSLGQGAMAGIITAAGVSCGLLGHTLLAAFGVGALLMTSQSLFLLIKLLGAAYLIYLGVKLLRSRQTVDLQKTPAVSRWTMFIQGALSNISNPKITIFYFAFLPQFISTSVDSPTGYLVILGMTFALLTLLIKSTFGYLIGKTSAWLSQRKSVIDLINRLSGSMLIGFGLKLALEQR